MKLKAFKRLEVEISSYCNLKCPLCRRTTNTGWSQDNLDLEIFKERFEHILPEIDTVDLCGYYGDFYMHPESLDFIRFIKDCGCRVSISTSGGKNDPMYWNELSKLLDSNDMVVFGIDGMVSNKRYRGTNWMDVMQNLCQIKSKDIPVEWQYIVFEHNQHELEWSKGLAEANGIEFTPFRSRIYNDEFREPTIDVETSFFYEDCAGCITKNEGLLYLNAQGVLSPCEMFVPEQHQRHTKVYISYMKNIEKINIYNNIVEDIIDNEFYDYMLSNKTTLCKEICL